MKHYVQLCAWLFLFHHVLRREELVALSSLIQISLELSARCNVTYIHSRERAALQSLNIAFGESDNFNKLKDTNLRVILISFDKKLDATNFTTKPRYILAKILLLWSALEPQKKLKICLMPYSLFMSLCVYSSTSVQIYALKTFDL